MIKHGRIFVTAMFYHIFPVLRQHPFTIYIYIYMYIEAIQCKLSLYLKKAGLASRNIVRGTQRICSSHYLFPREILLAGKNTGVSMSWLGNFVIGRGFAWELLTFSSISNRAGCGNSED